MNSKITLDIRTVIILAIFIIMVRLSIDSFPTIKPRLQECAYNYITRELNREDVLSIKKAIAKKQEMQLYYIGRGSCIDCREAINHIMKINQTIESRRNIPINNVSLKEEITDEEREFLDEINVNEIPVIILIEKGSVRSFGYYDIIAKNYKNRFNNFVEGEEYEKTYYAR